MLICHCFLLVVRIASAVCCIAAIAGLANQETARTGNILGIAGVAFGLSATAADMSLVGASVPVFEQTALLAGVGSGVGAVLASNVGPTELPQTVAAFHSLVGLAAMAGAAGEYFGNAGSLDIGTLSSIYLATFIGGITATGSMIAFGKLAGLLNVSFITTVLFTPVFLHLHEVRSLTMSFSLAKSTCTTRSRPN